MRDHWENDVQVNDDAVAMAKEQRRRELESQHSTDGYLVVRKELFPNRFDPAVTIRNGSISFNAACIRGLEDTVFVKLMINPKLGRLTAQRCDEHDVNAVRWCIPKPDRRKSRKMSCRPFTDLLYKTMGWDCNCRYRVLGYRICFEGEYLFVFDLKAPEIRPEKKRKPRTLENSTTSTQKSAEAPQAAQVGYYPKEISKSFGLPVTEFNRQTQVTELGDYVSMAMLTGPKETLSMKPTVQSNR